MRVSAPARPPRQPARQGGKLDATANMSDFWHKLGCCVVEKPQPVSSFSLAGWGRVWGPGVVGSAGPDSLHPLAEEEEETD